MATLKAEHVNPFLMAAKKVIQDVCFVDVEVRRPIIKETSFGEDIWVIIIGVTGEIKGQVLLAMDEKNACGVASKMCMMEVLQIDDFAASALSELGNMIMGNAATVFSAKGIGIDITPPTLSHGEVEFKSAYVKSLCVPMGVGDIQVDLFLALKEDN
ncbi:MAG: chemotaxis protein CheX [Eubacterium sp.]|nr:chemotaxis protein CheX [Eubacterium sp.]